MNTKSLLIKGAIVAGSLSLLGGLGATMATSASAAVQPVMGTQQFVTHSNQHADTTSALPGGVYGNIFNWDGSPVWAWDNSTFKFSVTPENLADGSNYRVTVEVVGSFHGFADPVYGTQLDSTGPVHGVIYYDVIASQGPNGTLLPPTEPGGTTGPSLEQMINQLFGGTVTQSVTGAYDFSY